MTADFDSFYSAEYPNVYRAARAWTGDEQAALDATQEAFVRAFARWRRRG
jgi:DNA-directed RNA polymerase specialized sigma24 family protein